MKQAGKDAGLKIGCVDRRPFDLFAYNADKSLVYTGPAVPPAANELG